MARHASDLLPMLQILAEDKAPLLELDKEVDLDKLRVFWLEDDGGFPVITPVHRFPFFQLLFVVDMFPDSLGLGTPTSSTYAPQRSARGPAQTSESPTDRAPKYASGESPWTL